LISLTIGAGQEKENTMNKKQFHTMNAYTLAIKGIGELFFSYDTPIGLNLYAFGGRFLTSNHKYSVSTTRQTNRYVKEHNLHIDIMDNASFLSMMKTYAMGNNFDLGRLR
jgi:hypothetical protein